MDDGRTPDQRRCGKTWKRPVVECDESVHFRPDGENRAMRGGDQRTLRGLLVGHHGRSGAAIFLAQEGVKRKNWNCGNCWSTKRWDRVFSATCIEVPWQLRTAESGETCRACGRGRSTCRTCDRDACCFENLSEEIRHEERSREVRIHIRVSGSHALGVRHAQCEGSSRRQMPRSHWRGHGGRLRPGTS